MDEAEKRQIEARALALMDAGKDQPGYPALGDEDALCIIMLKNGFDRQSAKFILAMERGTLPKSDGKTVIVYQDE